MFRRSVAPLLIATLIQRANSGASTVALGLFLAQLASARGHSITSIQVGLLPVVFYVTELSLALIMGSLSDRWGRRTFLVIGPLFGTLQACLLFFTPGENSLLYILALQAVAGISGAMTTPAVLGYLADFTALNLTRRMRIMSFYELATSGGIAVGVVMGGLLWDHFHRIAFLYLAVLYLVVSLFMALSPVLNQVIEHGTMRAVVSRYWRIIRTPRLFIFIPAWICINALIGVWLSSQLTFMLSMHVHNRHQLLIGLASGVNGGHLLSLVLGAFVLFFGLSLLFWAFFLNHVPRIRLMFTSIFGVYLACLALYGINHRGEGNDLLLFVWIPVLLIGIFAETSFAPSALAYLADISEETAKDRGLLMGLYSIFLGLGQILGNGIGGIFARNFGFDGLVYFTVILASVALASLLWLFWNERKQASRFA